jgi:hypothetical protein
MLPYEKLLNMKRELKLLLDKRNDARCLIIPNTPENTKVLMDLNERRDLHICNALSVSTPTKYIRFVIRKRANFTLNINSYLWWIKFHKNLKSKIKEFKLRQCNNIENVTNLIQPYYKTLQLPLFQEIDDMEISENISLYFNAL